MTGYTVHTGASKKFVSGWDKVFASSAESAASGKAKAKKEASPKAKPTKGKKSK
jgi:hypothetical protein